jgi:hypothetical protein
LDAISDETAFRLSHYVIPQRKTPWNDRIAGKMNSQMIQTQPDIVCYVSFPHTLEKILLKDFILSGIPDDKQ